MSRRMHAVRSATLHVEQLEEKALLAASSVFVSSLAGKEILEVVGTSGNDKISVQQGAGQVRVKSGSYEIARVPASELGGIMISGREGNDAITIKSSVKLATTLDGGRGKDTLQGGRGTNLLYGAQGRDTLLDGKGMDYYYGANASELGSMGYGDSVVPQGASLADYASAIWNGEPFPGFNYGGNGNRGWDQDPTNPLDAAFQRHDWGYDQLDLPGRAGVFTGFEAWDVDWLLASEAWGYASDPQLTDNQQWLAYGAATLFGITGTYKAVDEAWTSWNEEADIFSDYWSDTFVGWWDSYNYWSDNWVDYAAAMYVGIDNQANSWGDWGSSQYNWSTFGGYEGSYSGDSRVYYDDYAPKHGSW